METVADAAPTPTLIQALLAAQRQIENPALDATNPHYHNKYASLVAVRAAIVPVLLKHDIVVTQTFGVIEGREVLATTLRKGDEQIISAVPLPAYSSSQQWASAVTYIRRVALQSIVTVCGEADDDGEADRQTERPRAQTYSGYGAHGGADRPDWALRNNWLRGIREALRRGNDRTLLSTHEQLKNQPDMYEVVGAELTPTEKESMHAAIVRARRAQGEVDAAPPPREPGKPPQDFSDEIPF